MKRGHCTGEKRYRFGASDWYAHIEAATLAELDRTWQPPTQEVTRESPQSAGSTEQGISSREHCTTHQA